MNLEDIDPAAIAAGDQWEATVKDVFTGLVKCFREDTENGDDAPLVVLAFALVMKAQPMVLASLVAYALKVASENGWDKAQDPLEAALDGEASEDAEGQGTDVES